MQKHKKGKKATYVDFHAGTFYSLMIQDTLKWCSEDLRNVCLNANVTEPAEFRKVIEDQLAEAVPALAAGGEPTTDFLLLNQLNALLKKNVKFGATDDESRRKKAFNKFLSAERACKRANRRLAFYRKYWTRQPFAAEVLNEAAHIAQEILGAEAPGDEEIFFYSRFGQGATLSHVTGRNSAYHKMTENHRVTVECMPLLQRYFQASPELYKSLTGKWEIAEGNRVAFVPKTWDVDRTIAAEPSWNVFLQLGVDEVMKRRLRRAGITLKDQSRNYGPTREGSINGFISTIDLSSASDRLATELVRWVLPKNWFDLLDSLRSKSYCLTKNGTFTPYEKFSSMGNATTFPVESVIFYSIAKACCKIAGCDTSTLRVYGDDIIIDAQAALLLKEVLLFSGHEMNDDKSFIIGHFKESCGRDYLQGLNVRPVVMKEEPRDAMSVYNLYNRLLVDSIVPLPQTLAYLRQLVKNAHRGPLYCQPTGDFSHSHRKEDIEWDKRGCIRWNAWFISDQHVSPVFDKDYQRMDLELSYLRHKRPQLRGELLENTRLRLFLLGYVDGIPSDPARLKVVEGSIKIEFWPKMTELHDIRWERQAA